MFLEHDSSAFSNQQLCLLWINLTYLYCVNISCLKINCKTCIAMLLLLYQTKRKMRLCRTAPAYVPKPKIEEIIRFPHTSMHVRQKTWIVYVLSCIFRRCCEKGVAGFTGFGEVVEVEWKRGKAFRWTDLNCYLAVCRNKMVFSPS